MTIFQASSARRRRRCPGAAFAALVALVNAGLGGPRPAQATQSPPAAPLPAPSEPPAPAEPTPESPVPAPQVAELPRLSTRDRITFNAALDALVSADFEQARLLLMTLAVRGETEAARSAAVLIVERLGALERRRAAGLVPPLRKPTPFFPAADPTEDHTNARTPFVAMTTLLGLGLWGWSLPLALGLDPSNDARPFIGIYMLTAASSFIGPYLYTRTRPPNAAQLNLLLYGATRGAEWGLLLSNLLFARKGGDPDEHERAFAASLLVGSLAGGFGGAALASRLALTPGEARTIAVLGDYGLFAGFALGHILGFDDLSNDGGEPEYDMRARAMSAMGLAGSAGGLAAGRLLSLRRKNTWGDGEVMRAAGLLGVFTGATIGVALDQQDSRMFMALLLAGGGLGLVGGDRFVRDTNFTPGQAIVVDLALLAGGLVGAGLTYLLAEAESPTPYFVAATLGGATSGILVANTLADRPARAPRASNALPRMSLVPQISLPRAGLSGVTGAALMGSF